MVRKTINMKSSLTTIQIKEFEKNILKCQNANKYFDDSRINIIKDSSKLREKLLFIINDCPELLRYDSINSIVNHVLKTSNVLEIYDFLDISQNQKKYIADSLVKTE